MSVITITNDNFQSEVLEANCPVLLDFWAPWCGPCRTVSPVVDEISNENPEIKVGKVNVDDEEELARRFRVMSIPTLIAFRDGKVVSSTVGAKQKAAILQMLQE